jgi:hypothetical protein
MFAESENDYIGKILKKLSTGKSLKHLLLEMTWPERAKLLQKVKQIRKMNDEFQRIMASKDE